MSERITLHTLWAGVVLTCASMVALVVLAALSTADVAPQVIAAVLALSGPATGAIALAMAARRAGKPGPPATPHE